jgi:hypothetical protein
MIQTSTFDVCSMADGGPRTSFMGIPHHSYPTRGYPIIPREDTVLPGTHHSYRTVGDTREISRERGTKCFHLDLPIARTKIGKKICFLLQQELAAALPPRMECAIQALCCLILPRFLSLKCWSDATVVGKL